MNFYLCLAYLCLGIAAAAPQLDPTLDAKWEQWKSQHRRTYEGVTFKTTLFANYVEHMSKNEDIWRRATWEKNLRMIEMHNLEYRAGKHSFQMEMNKFGDMTNEEFGKVMNVFTQMRFQKKTKGSLFREALFEEIPESVDWRNKGYVTPVKNQGFCGSCWAFSATGAIEGQWFRKTGKLVSLSEQNLIDCSREEGNEGCGGGLMDYAFEYVKKNGGIDTEESYIYEETEGNCRYKPENSGANVTGYVDIPSGNESALTEAVATVGPISVAIDAFHTSFRFYKSGIYYEPRCHRRDINHGVLAVGYGVTKEGEKYWIVKNSWGEGWGNNGYILMARDKNNHCGISTLASYPEV